MRCGGEGRRLMRAVVIAQHGGPEALAVTDVERPRAGPGQALVRVAAAGLNRMDLFLRQGLAGPGVRQAPLPHVPGVECAGFLEALGPDTPSAYEIGDRVVVYSGLSCGMCRHCRAGQEGRCAHYRIVGEDVWGAHAEYVAVPARNLLKVPDAIPLHVAAAAPIAFGTAWTVLVSGAQVRVGERVVVTGASGGVATAAMAIAKAAGAQVLAGTRGTVKAAQLEELPTTDAVFDTGVPDWHRQVLALTDGDGADVVVDAAGAPTWPEAIRSLAPGGRLSICGATGGDNPDISIRELYQSHRRIVGSPLGGWADFHDAMQLVFRGDLEPVIHAVLPVEKIAEAHELMAADAHVGKIVLTLPEN